MYLHLGQDVVVRTKDIVAIFDIENASIGKATRNYLRLAEEHGEVINVSYELPKSFVVCQNEAGTKVYISQISPATLKKRNGLLLSQRRLHGKNKLI